MHKRASIILLLVFLLNLYTLIHIFWLKILYWKSAPINLRFFCKCDVHLRQLTQMSIFVCRRTYLSIFVQQHRSSYQVFIFFQMILVILNVFLDWYIVDRYMFDFRSRSFFQKISSPSTWRWLIIRLSNIVCNQDSFFICPRIVVFYFNCLLNWRRWRFFFFIRLTWWSLVMITVSFYSLVFLEIDRISFQIL